MFGIPISPAHREYARPSVLFCLRRVFSRYSVEDCFLLPIARQASRSASRCAQGRRKDLPPRAFPLRPASNCRSRCSHMHSSSEDPTQLPRRCAGRRAPWPRQTSLLRRSFPSTCRKLSPTESHTLRCGRKSPALPTAGEEPVPPPAPAVPAFRSQALLRAPDARATLRVRSLPHKTVELAFLLASFFPLCFLVPSRQCLAQLYLS